MSIISIQKNNRGENPHGYIHAILRLHVAYPRSGAYAPSTKNLAGTGRTAHIFTYIGGRSYRTYEKGSNMGVLKRLAC